MNPMLATRSWNVVGLTTVEDLCSKYYACRRPVIFVSKIALSASCIVDICNASTHLIHTHKYDSDQVGRTGPACRSSAASQPLTYRTVRVPCTFLYLDIETYRILPYTRDLRQETIRHDSVCDVIRFRYCSEIFDKNPWFVILASYGQGVAPATASYGLAGADLAWRANNTKQDLYSTVRVRVPYGNNPTILGSR